MIVTVEQCGDWFFKHKPMSDGRFMAWCAKTPDLGSGPLQVDWKLDVHFEIGSDPRETIARLKREVLS